MRIIAIAVLTVLVCLTLLFAWVLCKAASDWDNQDDPGLIRSCEGCVHYLGGGQCRANLEKECADDDFQLWEAESHEVE